MTPQEAINEIPEQRALSLIERLQPVRVSTPQSAWVLGWIGLEPDEFNEREQS